MFKNIAVDFHDNAITYSELEQQSDLLAKHLINNGVKQGDFVCVCLERSVEMVVALLAVLRSGAAYVPVDPSFPSDRVAYMVDDSQSKIIITTSEVKQKLRLQNHTCALLDNGWQQTLSVPANISLSDVNSSALACMILHIGHYRQTQRCANSTQSIR
ncbi:MAG: AMP-binding protein [Bacteroidetes bacterium]|nr:AMP-binding protein [Bacteroidota bacterium]